MTPILIHIKTTAPLGFQELEQFLFNTYGVFLNKHQLLLNDMPFSMCVGMILSFFNHNQIDFSIGNVDEDILAESIKLAFEDYENVISHYS